MVVASVMVCLTTIAAAAWYDLHHYRHPLRIGNDRLQAPDVRSQE